MAESLDLLKTSQQTRSVRIHPLNADLGTLQEPEVESTVVEISNAKVTWTKISEYGEESFNGLFQQYSDKSETPFKLFSLTLNQWHGTFGTFMKVREKIRSQQKILR